MKIAKYDRTYMVGYDIGDYLTKKGNLEMYTVIKIKRITIDDKGKDFNIISEVIELKDKTSSTVPASMLRWYLADESQILYSKLLKDYRPLTENEKLFYLKE